MSPSIALRFAGAPVLGEERGGRSRTAGTSPGTDHAGRARRSRSASDDAAGKAFKTLARLIRLTLGPLLVLWSERASSALPSAFLDERALDIRPKADHRSDLVAERTGQINRLRRHLVDLCAELGATIPARQLDSAVMLDGIARRLRSEKRSARHRVTLALVASSRAISRQADGLERKLRTLILAYRAALLAELGVGRVDGGDVGRTHR